MKKNNINSLFFVLYLILSNIILFSCEEGNEEYSRGNEIYNKLMSNKWSCSVYDESLLSQDIYILYFIDATHGVMFHRSRFLDIPNSTRDEDIPFDYIVEGNNVYVWDVPYFYMDGVLVWNDGAEIYKPSPLSADDYEYMKPYDPKEIERKNQLRQEILSCVKFEKTFDTYTCTYDFVSTLRDKYSPLNFEYGVEFGDGDYDYYVLSEDSSLYSFSITLYMVDGDDYAECGMYLRSLMSIEAKIDRGEKLSSEERAFYWDLKDILKEFLDIDFCSRAFVEMDGDRYYLE